MSQITYAQRYTISVMLEQKHKVVTIANCLEKDKSVIYREIRRNQDKRSGEYRYDLAERKCRERHKKKNKHIKFTYEHKEEIEELLRKDYSPEQVVGVLKKNGKSCVSHERIYQHIWSNKKRKGTLHMHLRRQGRRYKKRGSSNDTRGIIKNRTLIDARPSIVEKRKRFGDLEMDLIIGKNHKSSILTINDRASGVLKMTKVPSKKSQVITNAINDLLKEWKPYLQTITTDNGKEFAGHEQVAAFLGMDYYFAHPYHSWERGSNENLNGLIRQYFKKGMDFNLITEDELKRVETKLNNRPRKRFNFENPMFVMNQLLFNNKVAFMT